MFCLINIEKEMSFCHKLFPPYILATLCRRPMIIQTINSVRSNSLSLKYYRFIPSGCKDIGIRKFDFAHLFCRLFRAHGFSNCVSNVLDLYLFLGKRDVRVN